MPTNPLDRRRTSILGNSWPLLIKAALQKPHLCIAEIKPMVLTAVTLTPVTISSETTVTPTPLSFVSMVQFQQTLNC